MSRGRYGFRPAGPEDGPQVFRLGEQPAAAGGRSLWQSAKLGLLAVVVAQAVSAAIVATSSGHSAFSPIGQALRVLLVGPAQVQDSAALVQLDGRPADGGEARPQPGQVAGSRLLPAPGPVPASGRLTAAQIAAQAQQAGFRGQALVTAVAVSLAESGGRARARCYNTGHGCSARKLASTRSTDRGLWQINDRAWPDVSATCADDPACAARQAWRISHGGRTWRPWSSYKSGSYARHLDEALGAVLGRRPTAAELVAASRRAGADYRRSVGALPSPVAVPPGA